MKKFFTSMPDDNRLREGDVRNEHGTDLRMGVAIGAGRLRTENEKGGGQGIGDARRSGPSRWRRACPWPANPCAGQGCGRASCLRGSGADASPRKFRGPDPSDETGPRSCPAAADRSGSPASHRRCPVRCRWRQCCCARHAPAQSGCCPSFHKVCTAASRAYPLPMLPRLISRPRPLKRNSAMGRVEQDVPQAGLGHGLGQLCRLRHLAGPSMKAPGLDEGPDGDVERPGSFLVNDLGQGQQFEEVFLDCDGFTPRPGPGVEPADLAVRPIDRELVLQSIDEVKGQPSSFGGPRRRKGQDHFERGGHGPPAEAQQSRLGRTIVRGGAYLAKKLTSLLRQVPRIEELASIHGVYFTRHAAELGRK